MNNTTNNNGDKNVGKKVISVYVGEATRPRDLKMGTYKRTGVLHSTEESLWGEEECLYKVSIQKTDILVDEDGLIHGAL